MPISRRFQIAPSITRVLCREFGGEHVTEGHFEPQGQRQCHLRIARTTSCLVLTSLDLSPEIGENRIELPSAHAEALLRVCPGTLIFERSVVPLPGQEALVDRFVTPGQLDLVSVEFKTRTAAANFLPPVWFGGEVSKNESYGRVMARWGAGDRKRGYEEALEAVLISLRQGMAGMRDRCRRLLGSGDRGQIPMQRVSQGRRRR